MGTIYPGIEKFLENYLESLNDQTLKNFDLLLLNHGYNNQINKYTLRTTVLDVEENLTPNQVRAYGIEYAIKNSYDRLIFTDSDDYYSSNYVECINEALKKYDFAYCNIIPVKNGVFLNDYNFIIQNKTRDYKDIIEYNYIGLGSSGLNINRIKNIKIPNKIIALDWWLYTIMLLNGSKGIFTKKAINFYNQHSSNIVGLQKELTTKNLISGVKVKILHYQYFYQYCKIKEKNEEMVLYKSLLEDMNGIHMRLKDTLFRDNYLSIVNKNHQKIYSSWWSNIISEKRLNRYVK